ncbi:type I-F CRISPR-associated endoribonuclease Cas6/Csy4 [Vibrio parahaemolyticus]|nr:type I-F CRISPR-associated endoribonuclease Cas6/Csy4 [Vibrio parahaemolyticus]
MGLSAPLYSRLVTMNHYLDISLNLKTEIRHKTIQGLVSIVHATQTKSNELGGSIKLAIDFPKMVNESNKSDFGDTLRLIGSRDSLISIATNGNICNMEECGQIELSVISQIPTEVHGYVIVKRDRKLERFKAGKKGAKPLDVKPCFIALRSKANGRPFSINIVRIKSNKKHEGDFSTYGLSSNGSTIPHF